MGFVTSFLSCFAYSGWSTEFSREPAMEHTDYSTLKRAEHDLLLPTFKYTQFYTMPRDIIGLFHDIIGLFHVRLCGKPTSSTRAQQSLLYATLLPLGFGWGLRPHQLPREARWHITDSVPHLLRNMVLCCFLVKTHFSTRIPLGLTGIHQETPSSYSDHCTYLR